MNKELVGNIIEQAIKVTSFRKMVREACRKKELEYPLDEKVAEWIEEGYPFNVDDFIADYTEHEGIFRTPLTDFRVAVNNIIWGNGNMPTEDEIVSFFNKHGNNINLFCRQRTIKKMQPLERKVYLKTMTYETKCLVALWNHFIEESAKYGEDSCVYDIENRDNIVSTITAFWSEIFERIMLFPCCYDKIGGPNWETYYFEECVWPILLNEAGIELNYNDCEIKFNK